MELLSVCGECHREFTYNRRDHKKGKYCSYDCYRVWFKREGAFTRWKNPEYRASQLAHLSKINRFFKGQRPHNAKWDRCTEVEALELFDQYKNSELNLQHFGKSKHIGSYTLSKLFHRFFSDEFMVYTESQNAKNNNNYKRGRHFEWRVRDHYKKLGYFVIRSPRSKSPVDLTCIKKGDLVFIQCKTNGIFLRCERKELTDLAESVGARAVFAHREGHKLITEEL